MIEKIFGTQLREYAVRISGEKYELREEIVNQGFESASDLPHQQDSILPSR